MFILSHFQHPTAASHFPPCGTIKPNAKEVINELYDAGHEIIIWTCRCDEPAEMAKQFLDGHGIKYHKFNEHMDRLIEQYGNDTRKIWADIYIDDKQLGGLPDCWLEIHNILKTKHII